MPKFGHFSRGNLTFKKVRVTITIVMSPSSNAQSKLPQRSASPLIQRKRALKQAEIQNRCLPLLVRQGFYDTTTIQMAAAASISPATFFRYFATKEDVVLFDTMSVILFDRHPPAQLTLLEAVAWLYDTALQEMSPKEIRLRQLRLAIIYSTPELRARYIDGVMGQAEQLAHFIANRANTTLSKTGAHALAGAIIGVMLTALQENATLKSNARPLHMYLQELKQTLIHLNDSESIS
jgi:AcrR family transcriptional regulator